MNNIPETPEKICPECKVKKPICEYYTRQNKCKACVKIRVKKYGEENKEKVKASRERYYINNKREINKKNAEYQIKNKDKMKAYHDKWREDNSEKLKDYYLKYQRTDKRKEYAKEYQKKNKERRKAYILKNREKFNEQARNRLREKRKNDPLYRLIHSLRSETVRAAKKGYKIKKTLELLGCTIEFFRDHISSRWRDGMNWENWNNKPDGWNLDHILPIDSFDFSKPESWEKCFHYTNLQPLWRKDNRAKWNKLDWKPENKKDKNGMD